jgi:hypothetical protein
VIPKVKCDNGRPCKRCQKNNLRCLTSSPRPSQTPVPGGTENLLSDFPYVSQNSSANDSQLDDLRPQKQGSDAQALLDLYNNTDYCQQTVPTFFDQIMVSGSDYMSLEYMQPPPDLTARMPDVEFSLQPLIKCSRHRQHRTSMSEAHRRIHKLGKCIMRESIVVLLRDDMLSSSNHLGT